MGYNRENFNRIKQEYDEKYIHAREAADARRRFIHAEIPEIAEIDKILERTGARIMGIVCSGGDDYNVRKNVISVVSSAFNVSSNKIFVSGS